MKVYSTHLSLGGSTTVAGTPALVGKTGSGATFVVAASNASTRAKAQADYVCDGTADEVEINAALAALPAYGGKVLLSEGNFNLAAPIALNKDGTTLQGMGYGVPAGNPGAGYVSSGTRLNVAATFVGSYALYCAPAGTPPTNCLFGVTLRDFSIMGSSGPASVTGIYHMVSRGLIEGVFVQYMTGHGLYSTCYDDPGDPGLPAGAEAPYDNFYTNVRIRNSTLDGMQFDQTSTDHIITGCILEDNGGNGLSLKGALGTSAACMIHGCYIYSNSGKGIEGDAFQVKIFNTRIQDNHTGGIYLTAMFGTGFIISGCTLRNNSVGADNTYDGINIAPTTLVRGGQITGCDFFNDLGYENVSLTRQRYGINIANSSMNDLVIGPCSVGYAGTSSVFGTAFINDLGTNTKIWTPDQPKMPEGANFTFGTTTGTKIGTATTQKLGFFNATPVVQPSSTTDLRQALINLGLLASGGATPLDLNGGTFYSGTVSSGTTSGANLTLQSTAHSIKGKILFGTSAYDEVNNRLGIGTASPSFQFHNSWASNATSGTGNYGAAYRAFPNTNGSTSTATYAAIDTQIQLSPTATGTYTGASFRAASFAVVNASTTLTLGSVQAISSDIQASASGGTVTAGIGMLFTASAVSGGTIGTFNAVRVSNATGAGTVTTQVGLNVDALNKGGTSNISLLLGTLTAPTGNYAIYSSSTYASHLAGALTVAAQLNANQAAIGVTTALASLHVRGGNIRSVSVATPAAPSVTPNTTGSTGYTYYVVARDRFGNKTLPSAATVIANGAATPNNTITWTAVEGAVTYDVLKTDTLTLLANTAALTLNDTGQSTSGYTPATRNDTGDILLNNESVATAALNQASPAVQWLAHVWNTLTTQDNTIAARQWLEPISGAAPAGRLVWAFSGNGAAYSEVASVNSAGLGTFTSLATGAILSTGAHTITRGTITALDPTYNMTVTWNNAAVSFTAFKQNVTITAAATSSLLMDLQVGGTTKFSVDRYGQNTVTLGTLTATEGNRYALDTSATWNDASTVFSLIRANITDTASSSRSLFIDFQKAGSSQFRVDKNGNVIANSFLGSAFREWRISQMPGAPGAAVALAAGHLLGVGIAIGTASATVAGLTVVSASALALNDATGQYIDVTSAAVANSSRAGWTLTAPTSGSLMQFQFNSITTIVMKTGADLTSQRIMIGWFSGDPMTADTNNTVHGMGFRWSTATDTTAAGFKAITGNGTTWTATAITGLPAIAANTRYVLRIDTSAQTYIRFSVVVGGVTYIQDVATTLPGASTALVPYFELIVTAASARNIRFGSWRVEQE